MKFNILKPALAALVLVGTACTANYLDINTNPYEPSEDDMQTDGYIIGSALTSLASTVVSTDVNTAQFTDVLLGGPMGGYYSTTGGFTRTIMNYNPTDDWTNVFMYSDRTIPVLYSNLRELKKVTDDPIVLAIADIIKVAAMHRVTDTYGPIPYSMIGENGQIQVPYDSQEKVYRQVFRRAGCRDQGAYRAPHGCYFRKSRLYLRRQRREVVQARQFAQTAPGDAYRLCERG